MTSFDGLNRLSVSKPKFVSQLLLAKPDSLAGICDPPTEIRQA
jgi:hypothetical protein